MVDGNINKYLLIPLRVILITNINKMEVKMYRINNEWVDNKYNVTIVSSLINNNSNY